MKSAAETWRWSQTTSYIFDVLIHAATGWLPLTKEKLPGSIQMFQEGRGQIIDFETNMESSYTTAVRNAWPVRSMSTSSLQQ